MIWYSLLLGETLSIIHVSMLMKYSGIQFYFQFIGIPGITQCNYPKLLLMFAVTMIFIVNNLTYIFYVHLPLLLRHNLHRHPDMFR